VFNYSQNNRGAKVQKIRQKIEQTARYYLYIFLCIFLNLLLIVLYWFNGSIFFPTNPSFSLKNDKIVFFFKNFMMKYKQK